MKPIYKAPIVEQLKDLKRACEIALDMLDVIPLRNIGPEDMRREGLENGEFAICDWIVRPRFEESNSGCAVNSQRIPVSFEDWWKSLSDSTHYPGAKIVGNPFGLTYLLDRPFAEKIWDSMGMPR